MTGGSRKARTARTPSELGARLARVREEHRFSRGDLASKANLSERLVSRLETGSRGSAGTTTIFRLAHALQVRPAWLRSGEEPRALEGVEKRLVRLCAELDVIPDEKLAQAVKRSEKKYHRAIVVVASQRARSGERHTVDGWTARLDEIAEKLSPLMSGRAKRAR